MQTTTAIAISAWCGTRNVGCTAASHRGRSPSRAIASEVRPTPAMSESRAPSDAAAAPNPTIGTAHDHPLTATASATGALEAATPDAPRLPSTTTATTA